MSTLDFTGLIAAGVTQAHIDRLGIRLRLLQATEKRFGIFRAIKVGTHATVEALIANIETEGVQLSAWSKDIIPEVTLSQVRTLRLVVLTARKLGFTAKTPFREVHARAAEFYGLELCPSDTALYLALQYTDQPKGEVLWMMMAALQDSDRFLYAFNVHCFVDGRLLGADDARPKDLCNPDDQLVFILPEAI